MSSIIPLAKKYNPGKIDYPGCLSVKIDGTPIRCDVEVGYEGSYRIKVRTRQGKHNEATYNYFMQLAKELLSRCSMPEGTHTFIAEVTHKHLKDFKESSGVVRRNSHQSDLILNFFDYYDSNEYTAGFLTRITKMQDMLKFVRHIDFVNPVHQFIIKNEQEFMDIKTRLLNGNPGCEGLIYRSADALFKPGARHWDYQKIVIKPTVDLVVHSYEEATDKNGTPLGMVGRINCFYKGSIIGVGPGKMKHPERASEWNKWQWTKWKSDRFGQWVDDYMNPRIIQVEYKKDDSYDALREPTFQCWRPDKTEESYD